MKKQTGWLMSHELLLTVPETTKSKIKGRADLVSGESLHPRQMSVHYVLTRWKGFTWRRGQGGFLESLS